MAKRLKLKSLRASKGLTQGELAQALGVSIACYNRIEQGNRDGSIKFWASVKDYFELSSSEVWGLMYENNETKEAC